MNERLAAFAVAAVLATVARHAGAEPRSLTGRYSTYEEQAIHDAESRLKSTIDPLPEGKTIEQIEFIRLDPIDEHDPLPTAVDVLHTTSKPRVLRRELLVTEGDRYSRVLVDESARNLRTLPQLTLVLCVPMRGSSPERVRLVVITKDVWSLYVDFDLQATPGGLELLDLEPKEMNLAGLNHVALGRFVLQPKSYSLGASYEVPRLDGRWLDMLIDANVVINRENGATEGTFGSATVTRPLFSARAEWAWSVGVTWTNQITRRYVNAEVATFTAPSGAVPWAWRESTISEQAKLTRSFGWEVKNDVTVGASLVRSVFRVPTDPSLDRSAVARFEQTSMPLGEDRVGPFLQWHGYKSDFVRVLDFDTLGLQEDYRLGHDLSVRAYPVLRALGSTRDIFGVYASASYGLALKDGLVRASAESTVEGNVDGVSDASAQVALGLVTPRFLLGRLVFAATALNRIRNHLNIQSTMGGESLLRGYPSHFFTGKDFAAANFEYRSRPVKLASIQFGVVGFYDVGDAFDGFDHFHPKHSVGGGLRVVFPQIERAVLRFDLGFPITAGALPANVPPVSFFVAFHQAIGLPTLGTSVGH